MITPGPSKRDGHAVNRLRMRLVLLGLCSAIGYLSVVLRITARPVFLRWGFPLQGAIAGLSSPLSDALRSRHGGRVADVSERCRRSSDLGAHCRVRNPLSHPPSANVTGPVRRYLPLHLGRAGAGISCQPLSFRGRPTSTPRRAERIHSSSNRTGPSPGRSIRPWPRRSSGFLVLWAERAQPP